MTFSFLVIFLITYDTKNINIIITGLIENFVFSSIVSGCRYSCVKPHNNEKTPRVFLTLCPNGILSNSCVISKERVNNSKVANLVNSIHLYYYKSTNATVRWTNQFEMVFITKALPQVSREITFKEKSKLWPCNLLSCLRE